MEQITLRYTEESKTKTTNTLLLPIIVNGILDILDVRLGNKYNTNSIISSLIISEINKKKIKHVENSKQRDREKKNIFIFIYHKMMQDKKEKNRIKKKRTQKNLSTTECGNHFYIWETDRNRIEMWKELLN